MRILTLLISTTLFCWPKPPAFASWTAVNSASCTDVAGSVVLSATNAAERAEAIVQAFPVGDFTKEVIFNCNVIPALSGGAPCSLVLADGTNPATSAKTAAAMAVMMLAVLAGPAAAQNNSFLLTAQQGTWTQPAYLGEFRMEMWLSATGVGVKPFPTKAYVYRPAL